MTSWWHQRSFLLRLTFWYAGMTALVLVVFGLIVYEIVEHRLAAELDRDLRIDFDVVEAQLSRNEAGDIIWELQGAHGDEGFVRLFAWFEVWSEKGELLLRHWPVSDAQIHHPLPPPRGSSLLFRSVRLEPTLPVRLMERPARIGADGVVVRMFRDQTDMRQTLREIIKVFLLVLPFGILLASFGGYLLARKSMSPIAQMASQAKQITSESLSARLPVHNAHDELGQLASVMNDTLARLESSFEELKRFTADAAHELRTPLTALRAVGEVALQAGNESVKLRSALSSMLEEARRLTELTEALLTLARMEFSPRRPLTSVDLNRIVAEVHETLSVLAEQKHQTVLMQTWQSSPVAKADAVLLRHALLNILHNAIAYSPEGAGVVIRTGLDDDVVWISVKDEGPGIGSSDAERVFQRFARLDSGRARAQGGFGLGLAIAKVAVERCGGSIDLRSALGQGSTFTITLQAG